MAKSAPKPAAPTTGRVVHDAKGNSVWRLHDAEDQFRDTQTWVVRQLEVPGLSLDDEATMRYAGDPYNRDTATRK